MQKINLDDLTGFLDDSAISTVLAEHPEVKILWEKRGEMAESIEINGVNPILHVIFEAIAEKQIQQGNPPEAREAYERLKSMGLSRHAARGVIVALLIPHIYKVMQEKVPFEKEAYARWLKLLGTDLGKIGRNQPCPCGSGKKFKKCCLPLADSFTVFKNAGTLILGAGCYFTIDYLEILPPDSPFIQMENRAHIAKFLESRGDIEGAAACLQENVAQAEKEQKESLLQDALQDLQILCSRHPELSARGIEVTEKLIAFVEGEEKVLYCCDKADMLAAVGRLKEAEKEYRAIFESFPDNRFARYRYALFLDQHGRSGEAESILRALLKDEGNLDGETYYLAEEVLDDITSKKNK